MSGKVYVTLEFYPGALGCAVEQHACEEDMWEWARRWVAEMATKRPLRYPPEKYLLEYDGDFSLDLRSYGELGIDDGVHLRGLTLEVI